jgi:hypothetical protein
MDAKEWWHKVGTPEAKRVIEEAGTSWEYFNHICNKRKRPGVELARRLIAASGGALTLDELLFEKPKA